MIVAVGLDIVELARIKKIWQRHPKRFLSRHFTPEEISSCCERADPLPSIAARFAAKEAFQKCWPETHGWQDVWVVRKGTKPKLAFTETIQRALDERGLAVHVSLTHSRDHAAAVVILEETQGG
ncbi:MAG: holo-ACP synthase [Truepera sp.]|nr:holo-ACP synthase [Truepera sp.]